MLKIINRSDEHLQTMILYSVKKTYNLLFTTFIHFLKIETVHTANSCFYWYTNLLSILPNNKM